MLRFTVKFLYQALKFKLYECHYLLNFSLYKFFRWIKFRVFQALFYNLIKRSNCTFYLQLQKLRFYWRWVKTKTVWPYVVGSGWQWSCYIFVAFFNRFFVALKTIHSIFRLPTKLLTHLRWIHNNINIKNNRKSIFTKLKNVCCHFDCVMSDIKYANTHLSWRDAVVLCRSSRV